MIGAVAAILWTLLIAYSLYWVYKHNRDQVLLLGKMQGNAFFEKDILYRRWASRHGGVYVPITKTTQPNPYLTDIANRDIVSSDGRQLTLINPAYMTRQVFELAQEYNGTGRGHITSLKPLRPENSPDAWEREALHSFERGAKEASQAVLMDGKPYYRYMKPMIAEKSCLKCHAHQGYREGDIRGGLSVSVDLEPIDAMMMQELRGEYLNHGIIWILGVGVIGISTRRIGSMTRRLIEQNIELGQEVEERRVTQEALQDNAIQLEEEIFERRRIEEAVRVSEDKFSKAFANAPIIITICRLVDGIYLDVNNKFTELSGYSRDEAIGRSSAELGWISQELRQTILSVLTECGRVEGMELQLSSRAGSTIFCQLYAEMIVVDGQQCLLSLIHDVTEHRIVEEQLRQAQKMEAIGLLAGGVAHDFNNMLTVIIGNSTLLQMDPSLNKKQQGELEQIIASSEKAAQLTRGLLAFSRKEAVVLKMADLNDIVRHVQKFLRRVIGEDIELKTICNNKPMPVKADAAQIEQVLINLATNARDAMSKGGLLSVEIIQQNIDQSFVNEHGFGTPGSYACIIVSDSGCGMDEQTRSKIFEPFFTTKQIGKGTGLGMAIVYGIVKQHQGFINVYSEPGQGTTFRIYIPLVSHGKTELPAEAVLALPEGGSETILVAEDDPSVAALLQNILQSHGYQVIMASDGQEAINKFSDKQAEISLVLMDMIMPRKNGQEALREIRQLAPSIKACYLSGYTADFLQSREIDQDEVELIMKPVPPLELLRKVRDILATN